MNVIDPQNPEPEVAEPPAGEPKIEVPETEPVIRSEHTRPCGCRVMEWSNDQVMVAACVPCGMLEAAKALRAAGEALGVVAHRIRSSQQQELVRAMSARKDVKR